MLLLLLFFNYLLLNRFGDHSLSRLSASEVLKPSYQEMDIEKIEAFDGWVEILDEQLRVIEVKGNKRNGADVYTEKMLNELFYDQPANPYYVSLAPFQTEDGRTQYCLLKLPKHLLTQSYSLNAGSSEHNRYFVILLLSVVLLFLALFAINVFVYSRWTAATITNPLRYLAEGIKHVAGGRYGERIHYQATDELEQIRIDFNRMAERLERSEREKQKLEQSKRRMLLDLSHDLKTPITSIQGYVEALQRGLITDEARKQSILDVIHRKARHVTALIEEVFELSKLESPDYPLTAERHDLTELVRELAAAFYPAFEEKRFEFEYTIPDREIFVSFNYHLLYRAVANLLQNALTYNAAGTKVWFQLSEEERAVHIHVIDDGAGIAEADRENVFDAFVRGDQSRKSTGGTGLGLTISKNIVELHGGQIQLETGRGKTDFHLVLPKSEL